ATDLRRWTVAVRYGLRRPPPHVGGYRFLLRPFVHRVGRADDVHSRLAETLERLVGSSGKVGDTGDDDRGGAVLQQINLFCQILIPLKNSSKEIVHRPGDAVALRFSSDDDLV